MKRTLDQRVAALENIIAAGDNVPVEGTDYDGAAEMLDEWIDEPAQELTERDKWIVNYMVSEASGKTARSPDVSFDDYILEHAPPDPLRSQLDTQNTAITVAINRLSALYGLPEQSQIDTVSSVIAELKESRDD